MKFKTKAQNLINLKLKNASIPKVYYFRVKDYKKDKKTFLNNIKKRFKKKIAIRSSSSREDGINNSNAGMFKSFLNIYNKNI